MAEIKSKLILLEDVVYREWDDEYYLIVSDNADRLSCNKNMPSIIVWDQAYRNLYFDYGYNVIYSQYVYDLEEIDNGSRWRGYEFKGFFR